MAEKKPTTNSNAQILEAFHALDEKVTRLLNVLIGNAEEDKPGIMERVRKLEEWVANEKRLIYIIVVVIVTDIVMRLWALIAK